MRACQYCGAKTCLYEGGKPICIACATKQAAKQNAAHEQEAEGGLVSSGNADVNQRKN